jgi:hypothetical protein
LALAEAPSFLNAQSGLNPSPGEKDIFRVGISLFGVKNDTGNVFSYVSVDNLTAGRFFNATREDKDGDGIVESYFTFPNNTISAGTKFTSCSIVLSTTYQKCAIGINSPASRTEFAQFELK